MGENKLQKYLAIGVIVLVVILIVVKMMYNYQINKVSWKETDQAILVSACLDDLGGYAVRFPSQSTEYCNCTADKIINHFSKGEYLIINNKKAADQEDEMLPVILDCYNAYQEAMFKSSNTD